MPYEKIKKKANNITEASTPVFYNSMTPFDSQLAFSSQDLSARPLSEVRPK